MGSRLVTSSSSIDKTMGSRLLTSSSVDKTMGARLVASTGGRGMTAAETALARKGMDRRVENFMIREIVWLLGI